MILSKTEIRQVLQHDLILLEDTREQKTHISDFFRKHKVGVTRWRIKQGDYTFLIMPNDVTKNEQPIFFGDEFLIERKSGRADKGGGFSELKNNLTQTGNHNAFKEEFGRMLNVVCVNLLIENATGVQSIFDTIERKLKNVTFEKIFNSFIRKRNESRLELKLKPINVVFSPLEEAGKCVMELIFDFLMSKYHKNGK